ncbi:MAG: DUF1232 domain-containing protein [Bacteroidales bacterium]|nr:DUF1232 domain-containing protein [Bacteroidales bacterium]
MKLLRPKSFSDTKLFEKIGLAAKNAGIVVIYPALVLYYLFQDKDVPKRSKGIIIAALAYFIFPMDSIPDMTPIIGYSDDIGILYVTIMQLVKYVTPDILQRVSNRIADWFGEIKEVKNQEEKFLNKINKLHDVE